MKIFEKIATFLIRNKKIKKTNLVDEPFDVVCFFSNTAIGDTLFNTPVFSVFKQNFPKVKVIALLNPQNYQIFKDDPNLDEIILYNGRWSGFLKTLKALKSHKIDLAFLLHSNEPQATPLAVLSGAKYIFKLPNLKNKFNKFHSNEPADLAHKVGYAPLLRLEQLKFVGINSNLTRTSLYLNDDDFSRARAILGEQNSKIIGFQMGASTLSRQWFSSRWIELARLILQDTNYKIILTGSPKERNLSDEFCKEFQSEIESGRISNLAGLLDLRAACALLKFVDIFITPDTGPLHIAAALETPTIGLFVVGDHKTTNPDFDAEIHEFIQKPKTCTPCVGKNCKFQECMLQISAQEVYEKLVKIANRT